MTTDYWSSLRGRVLRSMILDGASTIEEIMSHTDVTRNMLSTELLELIGTGMIDVKIENDVEKYYVMPHIIEEYMESRVSIQTDSETPVAHREWIMKWIEDEKILAPRDASHFFLDRGELTEFMRKAIKMAKKSILVVNPFVDETNISVLLCDMSSSGVDVRLMTRPASDGVRTKFHDRLIESGVKIRYSGGEGRGPHAKIIVIDREIAILSSMNLIATSESGHSWETGIVTTDSVVVASITDSMEKFYEQTD